jgi:hypothetical protein
VLATIEQIPPSTQKVARYGATFSKTVVGDIQESGCPAGEKVGR